MCGGVTAIIAVALLLPVGPSGNMGIQRNGRSGSINYLFGLVGGVLGFLPFNRHPAKIFMGDAGSMLLGFVVAALMMLFAEQVPRWWMASIVIFGLPILDTATALVRRFLNKKPLFVSDRGHVYDQLMDRGIPLKKTRRDLLRSCGFVCLSGTGDEPGSYVVCSDCLCSHHSSSLLSSSGKKGS